MFMVSDNSTGVRTQPIVQMAAWCFAVLFWELMHIPPSSHVNSWRGLWLSILIPPISSFMMAKTPLPSGRFFIYGCFCSLLFVPRFLGMDRFSLWLQYRAPSNPVILTCWILFALALGAACYITNWIGREFYRST
jgi:hypothetical protein